MTQLAPSPSQPARPILHGLVSMLDMINFSLSRYHWSVAHLESLARGHDERPDPLAVIKDSWIDTILHFLKELEDIGKTVELPGAMHRVDLMRVDLELKKYTPITNKWAAVHLRTLREAIEGDIKDHAFYYYPLAKAKMVRGVRQDWAATLEAFPASRENIEAAVDCYALGHNHASIHHSMMVLEDGLVAVALKLKLKFNPNRTTWSPLIDDIRDTIAAEIDRASKPPKGTKPKKMTAVRRRYLEACQEAALDLRHFKNVWRDHVAHNRGDYDENDAKKVIDHTRSFMEVVSTKLKLVGRS